LENNGEVMPSIRAVGVYQPVQPHSDAAASNPSRSVWLTNNQHGRNDNPTFVADH